MEEVTPMLDPQKTKNKQLDTNTTTATGNRIVQTVQCLTCRAVIEERIDGVLTKSRICRCQREGN
jgi:hypothetical protein